MKDSIEILIQKIEAEFEDLAPGTLKPETSFDDIEDWDSMNALILIALVDTEYDITLSGDDMRSLSSVQDLYTLISNRSN